MSCRDGEPRAPEAKREAKMAIDAITAQMSPYAVEVEAGETYRWCRCGRSRAQPFCDGSHVGTGIEPLAFVAERTETVILCGCKETGSAPFCDGTHNVL
jgi:CDGSH-type Zn-finger protein